MTWRVLGGGSRRRDQIDDRRHRSGGKLAALAGSRRLRVLILGVW